MLKKIKKVLNQLKKIKISKILFYLILTLSLILVFVCLYIQESFYNVTVEQLIYSIRTATGTSDSMIMGGVVYVMPRVIFIYLILLVLKVLWKHFVKIKSQMNIKIKNKIFTISLINPLNNIIKLILSFLVLFFSIYYVYISLGVKDYLSLNQKGTFIEDNYVNPEDVKITAPEKKQNLIYIYVESLETSLFSNENGGDFQTSVIPNLEKLASDNINFSNTDVLGGYYVPYGTNWTVAGIVGSTAGIPLKVPAIDADLYSGYGEFLPGAYTLGEVLEDNGYHNYMMLGSDATFGGRGDYFKYHGNYEVYDYNYAIKQHWIDKDYHVWWGYEDKKLFKFAKAKLLEISENDEPFNFTMLTADTHATDGYLDASCDAPFDEQYLNTFHCADKMLSDFIDWLKEQDFYEDTTIVITGDHLTMQKDYMNLYNTPDNAPYYERKVFNTFINSKVKTDNYHNINFTTFDIYPTTLAALGFEIDGNRLGFGYNLFAKQNTLVNELGINELDTELSKVSDFYNDYILGDTYNKMKNIEMEGQLEEKNKN